MANGRNNKKMGGNSNAKSNGNSNGKNNGNGNSEETAELSAEDYEIIAAALATLGDFFAFLSLVKARQVTKETGGEIEVPEIFTLSTKKKPYRRKLR